jgi:hypothetical protein
MKKTIAINGKASSVTVSILFGFASIGRYWVWLYDGTDKNPKSVGEGASDDDQPDVLSLGSAAELGGRLLYVQCSAASASGTPDLVGTTLTFLQDGQEVPDGSVSLSAALNPGQQADFNFAIRLQVGS